MPHGAKTIIIVWNRTVWSMHTSHLRLHKSSHHRIALRIAKRHEILTARVLVHVMYISDPPKITQYSRSPSTRSLSVMQESPDSVHAAVDIAHAYLHHAVEQICQPPPQVVYKRQAEEHAEHEGSTREPEQCEPNCKVQCDEAGIEGKYDTGG